VRQTSEVTDTRFPFAEDSTPFILVLNIDDEKESTAPAVQPIDEKTYARGFSHAWTVEKKVELVELAKALSGEGIECSLLACWPGGHTDTFLVDDLDEALAALRI
jgi:hypothetical protein